MDIRLRSEDYVQDFASADDGTNDGRKPLLTPNMKSSSTYRHFASSVLLFAAMLSSTVAAGVRFRLPLDSDTTSHYFVDRDPSLSRAVAWDGSANTYEGHRGTDYPVPIGTEVHAAADGILIEAVDLYEAGELNAPDNGNFVRLNHGNDAVGVPIISVYLHLKKGSVTTKANGSLIACGEVIARSGNTGRSDGPHLHFETQKGLGGTRQSFDPYAMPNTGELGWWANFADGSPSPACAERAFQPGDVVEVADIGPGTLAVRAPDANSTTLVSSRRQGDVGTILEGPALTDTGTGLYARWHVKWADNVEGWSAEHWLRKTNAAAAGVEIAQAVMLNWPSSDGKLYQIYQSYDAANWLPYGPPQIGTGESGSAAVPVGNTTARFFKVEPISGWNSNRLVAVEQIIWESATFAPSSSGFDCFNLRLSSSQSTFDDLVDARFVYDPSRQIFSLQNYETATGIGVFADPFFAKDNTNIANLDTLKEVGPYWVTFSLTNDTAYMDCSAGQVLSFNLYGSTDDFTFNLIAPDNPVVIDQIFAQSAGVITGAIPIKKTAQYRVRIRPLHNQSVSLYLRFMNANHRLLTSITNGSYISASFVNNLHDYSKYRVHLEPGQLLTLPQPSTEKIRLRLVDQRSRLMHGVRGLSLLFKCVEAGDYYLFVNNDYGHGESYSGTVSITTPPGFAPGMAIPETLELAPAARVLGRSAAGAAQ